MISLRLKTVASFVSKGAVLADIGSDHAYLPCYLVEENVIQKAYACEVKKGPLAQSKKTIETKEMKEYVYPVLSDGLKNVPGDVSEVVIAGMGVHTILAILEQSIARLPEFHHIIVQANHNVELLRTFLSDHQYNILAEAMVFEDKFYEIVVFEAKNGRVLRQEEIVFGPFLLEEQSSVFVSYYEQLLQSYQGILEHMDPSLARYQELLGQVAYVRRFVRECF